MNPIVEPTLFNLTEARNALRERTGHNITEPMLIDLIGQGRLQGSLQVDTWLSLKEPYELGLLQEEHQFSGIVDIRIDENQALRLKRDPYHPTEANTVFMKGVAWQPDVKSQGHGYPIQYDATCILIRAAELDRLAEDIGLAKTEKPESTGDIADTGTATTPSESAAKHLPNTTIAVIFAAVSKDVAWWKQTLRETRWGPAKTCAYIRGHKGKNGQARWNPAEVARWFLSRDDALQDTSIPRRFNREFQKNPILELWREEWSEFYDMYYSDQ